MYIEKLDMGVFFQRVSESKKRALLLDYDGTLAPHRVERDRAFPYPGVRDALNNIINSNNSRLVIVSGRFVKDVIPLIGLETIPEIFGSHGCERRSADGSYDIIELAHSVKERFDEVDTWARDAGLERYLEKKPVSRAIHTRGLSEDEAEEVVQKARARWSGMVGDGELVSHDFNGGVELRLPGMDKGSAIDTILSELDDDTLTVYLGDDLTDEDAFRALKGRGVSILVADKARESAADYWLSPPDELLELLNRWAEI